MAHKLDSSHFNALCDDRDVPAAISAVSARSRPATSTALSTTSLTALASALTAALAAFSAALASLPAAVTWRAIRLARR